MASTLAICRDVKALTAATDGPIRGGAVDVEEPLEAVAGHAGEPSRRRGLPRRSTDRNTRARLGQLALAVTAIITTKLIKWADRYHHT